MKATILFICLFILVLINTGNALPKGYVITKNNDTVYCNVKLSSILIPQYQSVADGKYHTIKTKDFNGYLMSGFTANYTLKEVGRKHKPVFVLTIVKGKVNLYTETEYLKDDQNNWISCTNYYIAKAGEPLTEFATSGFLMSHGQQTIHDMLSDRPEIAAEFEGKSHIFSQIKLDISKIVRCVKEYDSEI
jgi:hypothetical protein